MAHSQEATPTTEKGLDINNSLVDDINLIDDLILFYQDHGWCKGAMARDTSRHETKTHDPRSVAFCYIAAGYKLGYKVGSIEDAFMASGLVSGDYSVIRTNDQFGQKRTAMHFLNQVRDALRDKLLKTQDAMLVAA